jgi:hypothetical protein
MAPPLLSLSQSWDIDDEDILAGDANQSAVTATDDELEDMGIDQIETNQQTSISVIMSLGHSSVTFLKEYVTL